MPTRLAISAIVSRGSCCSSSRSLRFTWSRRAVPLAKACRPPDLDFPAKYRSCLLSGHVQNAFRLTALLHDVQSRAGIRRPERAHGRRQGGRPPTTTCLLPGQRGLPLPGAGLRRAALLADRRAGSGLVANRERRSGVRCLETAVATVPEPPLERALGPCRPRCGPRSHERLVLSGARPVAAH